MRKLQLFTVAQGFCELGMWQDAWDELEKLPPEERAAPEVLQLRLGIFIGLRRWESAAELAESLLEKGATFDACYQLGAYAIRRCRSVAKAKEFLLQGERTMSENATWHFNLACYECQLGDMDAAKDRLQQAFLLNPDLRVVALEEKDLQPIWRLGA